MTGHNNVQAGHMYLPQSTPPNSDMPLAHMTPAHMTPYTACMKSHDPMTQADPPSNTALQHTIRHNCLAAPNTHPSCKQSVFNNIVLIQPGMPSSLIRPCLYVKYNSTIQLINCFLGKNLYQIHARMHSDSIPSPCRT